MIAIVFIVATLVLVLSMFATMGICYWSKSAVEDDLRKLSRRNFKRKFLAVYTFWVVVWLSFAMLWIYSFNALPVVASVALLFIWGFLFPNFRRAMDVVKFKARRRFQYL